MLRNLLSASLLMSLLLFISCDENSTNPVPGSLFPLAVGNYWVYETFELDRDSSRIFGTEQLDSVVVVEQSLLGPLPKYRVWRFRDAEIYDTSEYVLEGNIVLELIDPDDISHYLIYDKDYLRIVDPSSTSWHLLRQTRYNVPMEFADSTEMTTYNINVNGEYSGQQKLDIMGVSHICRNYSLKVDELLDFATIVYDTISVETDPETGDTLKVNRVGETVAVTNWRLKSRVISYAENVGPVMIIENPSYFWLKAAPSVQEIPSRRTEYSGRMSILQRYGRN